MGRSTIPMSRIMSSFEVMVREAVRPLLSFVGMRDLMLGLLGALHAQSVVVVVPSAIVLLMFPSISSALLAPLY